MGNNIFENITMTDWNSVLKLGDIVAVGLILVLFGCLFYSFMLFLKVRILIDTVESENSTKVKALVYANLLISILVSIIGTIIIVLE